MTYDEDALEALDDGEEPACHAIVGVNAIFQHAPLEPDPSVACTGYHAWLNGVRGFKRPHDATCTWTRDATYDGDIYDGSCGVKWEFIDGRPEDNGAYFCPRCGGRIVVQTSSSAA